MKRLSVITIVFLFIFVPTYYIFAQSANEENKPLKQSKADVFINLELRKDKASVLPTFSNESSIIVQGGSVLNNNIKGCADSHPLNASVMVKLGAPATSNINFGLTFTADGGITAPPPETNLSISANDTQLAAEIPISFTFLSALTPGWHDVTVSLTGGEIQGSDTEKIAIVGIHIVYGGEDVEGHEISVIKGLPAGFLARPNPSDASWPPGVGARTWSGSAFSDWGGSPAVGDTTTLLNCNTTGTKVLNVTYGSACSSTSVNIKVVVEVDLDVDSDNTTYQNYPDSALGDRENAEDALEEDSGVRVFTNYLDYDEDSVPGFADGIEIFGNGTANSCAMFEPIVLDLSEITDISNSKIVFRYSGSNPSNIIRTGSESEGYDYTPASGILRIWVKDGPSVRNLSPAI